MTYTRSWKGYALALSLMAFAAGACAAATSPPPELSLPNILALKERLNAFAEELPDSGKLGISTIIAYEENKHFVYVMGRTPSSLRRVFYIKPSTLIVSDVLDNASDQPATWIFRLKGEPKVEGRRITVGAGDAAPFCETVVPKDVDMNALKATGGSIVEVKPKKSHERVFVHVLHTGGADAPGATLVGEGIIPQLKITVADTRYDLVLPAELCAPGTVAISKTTGESIVARRLLPSGILPHGKRGVDMLARWDNAYRRNRRPGWDTGRVATELRRVVEDGTIKPCRAVVLGCGTGTNAEYLAGRGFEVTAIDLAPTALVLAKEKSDKTGSGVRWMLADVLATPDMEPFDFIFDRGCYHGARRYNAAGFVAAARRLSRPGTQFLILAGNANEAKHYGPPRVKEEDIRTDFSPSFKFTWLKAITFDLGRKEPSKTGPLAWSILLERKKE